MNRGSLESPPQPQGSRLDIIQHEMRSRVAWATQEHVRWVW